MNDEKNTKYEKLGVGDNILLNTNKLQKNKINIYNKEYIEKIKRLKEKKYFGSKTIGKGSSYIYLINQIFGSGIVSIPYVFKSCGWLPCLIMNILICVLTAFNTLLFLRTMTMIPNNIHFNKRYEYISTVCYFLGKNNIFFLLIQICFYASILASNIISIVIVSHAVDHILINIFGYTVGFVLYPNFGFTVFNNINDLYYTKNYILCITVGYIINAITSIYFSQSNLEDNMKIQFLSFFFLMSTIFQMIYLSILKIYRFNINNVNIIQKTGIKKYSDIKYPSAFGDFNFRQLLSSYIASYSTVTVIPCWANEMKSDVKIIKTVWLSNFFCCFIYYIYGLILCTAYPHINNDNILNDILQNPLINIYMKISIYMFDLLTIAPGIYVYCIATRYNLINSNICSEKVAFIFGTIFPFLISWFFTSSSFFENIFTWSSLIFSFACNFITPSIIYLIACKNIPYSEKNPLKYIHVLYDPNEYKKKKPLYNILYSNFNDEKSNFDYANQKSINIKKEIENEKNIFEIQPNSIVSKEDNKKKIKQFDGNSNDMHDSYFLKSSSYDSDDHTIAKIDENSINNKYVNDFNNGKNNILYDVDKINSINVLRNTGKANKKLNSHSYIQDKEKRNDFSYYYLQNRYKMPNDKTNSNDYSKEGEIHIQDKRKNTQYPSREDFIVSINKELTSCVTKEGNSIKKKKKSVSLNVDNNLIKTNTEESEWETKKENYEQKQEEKKEVEKKTEDKLILHESFEKDNYFSKDNIEKNKKKSDEYYNIEKKKKDPFIFRKYNSLFNINVKNLPDNTKMKNILPNNIRKSRKHKTVMGFEKKNKKNKNVSIINLKESSESSDFSDDILNDKIIADLSRDIYNDIKIIKKNYEREEYLIKFSDIFDSFLNLKLILESEYNEKNSFNFFYNSGITNQNDFSNIKKENNTINGNLLSFNNSNKCNFNNGRKEKSFLSDIMNKEKKIVDKEISENNIEKIKRKQIGKNEQNSSNYRKGGIKKNEENEEGKINENKINISPLDYLRNNTIHKNNKKEKIVTGFTDDIYEKKLRKIKEEIDMIINGINNNQNFTWAFDGNKNRDDSNVILNNKNINVSNVKCFLQSNDSMYPSYRKSKSESYFSILSLNKRNFYKRDKKSSLHFLNKLGTKENSLLNNRMSDDDINKYIQIRSADYYRKFTTEQSDEKPFHSYSISRDKIKKRNKLIKDSESRSESSEKQENDFKKKINLRSENFEFDTESSYKSDENKNFKDKNKFKMNNKKIKPKEKNYIDFNENNIQSKDRLLYFLNSYSRKSKMYKDINRLTVPDNVYNVIPKINKINGKSSFDDNINNIFNYYKYHFLLSFSEKNKKRGNLNIYKNIRNANLFCNYRNNENNSLYNNSDTNNKDNKLNENINSFEKIQSKELLKSVSKSHYLNKFPNDEKKEPLLNNSQNEKQFDDLPTINLICPEKPLCGYEDAYQIDDYINGKINENIIHVYPSTYLRIKHVEITELLLFITIMLLFISILYDFIY
ncbi:amino acid transporter, putative [Plasmodium relictum]|uniref:Amino acid transporter, putative n=1 Tax=Plasmodium relictum TaxID=85471 RepID=A0A1J1H793_PLARL|nr:amino acid transporter, putative [Plasmodium relictum]CRH00660.1 amino acid transporter, putative [Plasmodium relictum]